MGKKKKNSTKNSKRRGASKVDGRKAVKLELLLLYGYRDLLTGEPIDDYSASSFHHIIKKEYGGKYTEENGAMLLVETHRLIHNIIELYDPELFDLLTECLEAYKICLDKGLVDLSSQFEQEVQPLILSKKNSYINNRR